MRRVDRTCPAQSGSGQSGSGFAALWLESLAHGGEGEHLMPAFLSSPGGSEGDGVCVRSVQPGAHQVTETDPDCLKPRTVGSREPRLLGSQRGITLPEDACARCSSCQCQAGGRPALLAMQHLPHQLGPCSRALPTAMPLSLRLSPGSCSKPWVLPGTHCTLPCTCPGPVAWLSDGGATLTTCGPTSTSWVGQNNLRALSLPFPALC